MRKQRTEEEMADTDLRIKGEAREGEGYAGLDYFRLIAALLVIAIHTSPLESFTETGDFLLTRVAARVAVPFFFMTSGFFLISGYAKSAEKLRLFTARIVRLYGFAILLYLPLNLYHASFETEYLLPNLLKDLVFDGTFYHLWFFPASALGACIAWLLVRKFGFGRALFTAGILYLIGLFGDSYYGFSESVPALKGLYDLIFQVTDQTRNGIFFAPVFFLLGGFLAESRKRGRLRKNVLGFLCAFVLMTAEAFFLRAYHLQRRDSMYFFLIPCMYFLFCILLQIRDRRRAKVRTLALTVYLIHPLVIVGVRIIARAFSVRKILLENSAVYALTVCILSLITGILTTEIWEKIPKRKNKGADPRERAYLEIHSGNLRHNAEVLQRMLPEGCELMAVVKANGYGHGACEIGEQMERAGVKAFAVATIDEGIRLRESGIRGEILILGYTAVWRAAQLKKYNLTQTLIDYDHARCLNAQRVSVKVHIKIDTGMHRLGTDGGETLLVKEMFEMKHFKICGIYTHLCCAQSREKEDIEFTQGQIKRFFTLLEALKKEGITLPKIHMQSSYGLWNYPNLECDYVRAGIALYGIKTSQGDKTVLEPELRPVLSLKSRVVLIRSVKAGSSVGYDRSYTVSRDSRIAVLPIGYADGFPRVLSGEGELREDNCVLIRGSYAPIVGKICMDQMTVDVTEIAGVKVGDEAMLIGPDPDGRLDAAAVARRAGSISNELLCRMGTRLPVIVTDAPQRSLSYEQGSE